MDSDPEVRAATEGLLRVLSRKVLKQTEAPPVEVPQSSGEAQLLLERYRQLQAGQRTGSSQQRRTSGLQTKCTRLINIYRVERSLNKLQWKRCSDIVTIGTLMDSDDFNTTKQKCAAAFKLSTPGEQLVLTRGSAKICESAFQNLGQFLSCLSAQQRTKISFGIGVEEFECDDMPELTCFMPSEPPPRQKQYDSESEEDSPNHSSRRSRLSHESRSSSHSQPHQSSRIRSRSSSRSRDRTPPTPVTKGSLPTYTHEHLMSATDNRCKTNLLGKGAFGEVYLGRVRSTCVAIKFFKKANQKLTTSLDMLSTEASILTRYSHPNLVLVLGVCADPEHPAIIYEFMENGSLSELLFGHSPKGRKLGDIQMRSNLLLEAGQGLAYLHSKEGAIEPVVHLDIKSSNILLDGTMRAKLGDFGFAMQLPELATGKSFVHTSMVCGSEGYIAPEFHRGELGPKADVFSFGVVILEVYSELKAYDSDRTISTLSEHFEDAFKDLDVFRSLCGPALKKTEDVCAIPYEHICGLAHCCLVSRHKRATMEKVVALLEELVHMKLTVVQ